MMNNLDLSTRTRLQEKNGLSGTGAWGCKLERITERLHLSVGSLAHAVDEKIGSRSDVLQFPLQRIERRRRHIDGGN